jgi:hypothetical protein
VRVAGARRPCVVRGATAPPAVPPKAARPLISNDVALNQNSQPGHWARSSTTSTGGRSASSSRFVGWDRTAWRGYKGGAQDGRAAKPSPWAPHPAIPCRVCPRAWLARGRTTTADECRCYGRELAPGARGRRTEIRRSSRSPPRGKVGASGASPFIARPGGEEVRANCDSRASAEHKDRPTH